MIARIIPIKRLPRQLSTLDYLVPKELESLIQIGQLVSIEIRQSQVFGIVLSITDSAQYSGKIKELSTIVQPAPLLSDRQLHIYKIISRWYSTPISTILKISVLPQQKRKLKQAELFAPFETQHSGKKIQLQTKQYTSSEEFLEYIQQNTALLQKKEQLLILCPLQNRTEELERHLQKKGIKTVIWNGRLSTKEQFERWIDIRNGTAQVIIGSRNAALLAFYHLKKIIIDQYHHDGHKQFEQTPLIDSRDIASLLSEVFGTELIASVPKIPKSIEPPIIIDMRGEQAGAEYSLISQRIIEQLQTLQGDACFWLNRRGYASSFSCQSCGFIASCHSCHLPYTYHKRVNQLRCNHCHTRGTIFSHCPNCKENMLKLRGAGSELLGQELRQLKLELNLPHKIIEIDSDVDESELLTDRDPNIPVIIYGTQKALPFVDMQKNRLFVVLKANTQLAIAEYTAEHEYYQKIQWIRFFQHPEAKLYLQSMNPEHPFFADLLNSEQFQERMLIQRKTLHYPPYCYLTRYLLKAPSEKQAIRATKKLHQSLSQLLTQEKKSITISNPYALHPIYYRGGYWYAILVRFTAQDWKNDLLWLNRYFPASWRVDPNPRSIFSVS